jgi:tRNA threonylcarbamoyladenosine biosynthesis protein TsaB
VIVLGLDTATPRTAVALQLGEHAEPIEADHDPQPGERPGHATHLLPLAARLLADAGLTFRDVDRIAVGTGPGTFTGLRIGVASARALAQASGAEIAPVPTLQALADAVDAPAVLAVLDARRGEAFVGGYEHGREVMEAAALTPERLGELGPPPAGGAWLAAGDGAVRFRDALERAGTTVLPDIDPAHRITAAAICRLGRTAALTARDDVVPTYVRAPDAIRPT